MADVSAELYVPQLGRSLPLLLNVWPDAGELLGLSRFCAYAAVKTGEIPSIRVAGRVKIPTARLLEQLGITMESTPQVAAQSSSDSRVPS